jgi:hypothetical protein
VRDCSCRGEVIRKPPGLWDLGKILVQYRIDVCVHYVSNELDHDTSFQLDSMMINVAYRHSNWGRNFPCFVFPGTEACNLEFQQTGGQFLVENSTLCDRFVNP